MNKIVYKLPLPRPGENFRYSLRHGFIKVHVGLQNNDAYMWFEVNPEETRQVEVQFMCVGTGWNIDDVRFSHIGTIVAGDGLVWHYYAKFIDD